MAAVSVKRSIISGSPILIICIYDLSAAKGHPGGYFDLKDIRWHGAGMEHMTLNQLCIIRKLCCGYYSLQPNCPRINTERFPKRAPSSGSSGSFLCKMLPISLKQWKPVWIRAYPSLEIRSTPPGLPVSFGFGVSSLDLLLPRRLPIQECRFLYKL